MKHSPRFLARCEAARKKVREIDANALAELLADPTRAAGTLILDVREDHEWALRRIPGTRHLGRGILERDIEALVPDPDADIVLLCGGGYRSALAAESLGELGYTRVSSLAGGLRGWIAAGLPVEEG
jgi:rhodanese-related sulfurtransferase